MSRACRVRSVYSGLSQTQHGVSDISCSIPICTDIVDSTSSTGELAMISYSFTSAHSAELRCHKRADISYQYANSFCFVRQEAAELGKAPAMHFSSSSCCFADVGQVLQNNLGDVRIDTIRDNLFCNVVVSPCPEPFLSAAHGFQQPFATSSAFSLKSATKESIFPIHAVGILGCIESGCAGHCRVAYAQIDSYGASLPRIRNSFTLECETEPMMSTFVSNEQPFSDLPKCEILQEAIGNLNRKCDAGIKHAQRKEEVTSIREDASGSVKVISNRCSVDNRLRTSLLDDTATLLDARNGELCWQSLPEFSIDVRMQFDIVRDAERPCRIDAQLQSDFVCDKNIVNSRDVWQSDSCSCSQGRTEEHKQLFKANDFIQMHEVMSQFLHRINTMVSLAQIL